MLSWVDHLLALILAVFFPLRASTFGYRRLLEAIGDEVPRVRRSLYAQAMVIQWSLALAMLSLWAWRGRSWEALGVAPQSMRGLIVGTTAALALAAVLWLMRTRARRDPEALARLVQDARNVERVLPHTRGELRLFYGVSVTAGVCEELLYRGYLLWYFGHGLPTLAALAVTAVIFGFGHSYQGWRGVVGTSVIGVLLGIIYLLSGSLWPSCLVHAITDMHAGSLAHSALSRTAALDHGSSAEETGPASHAD